MALAPAENMAAALRTFEFIERANRSADPADIAGMLFSELAQLGFSGLAMSWLPPAKSAAEAKFQLVSLPKEYFQRYAERHYDRHSAVVRHMYSTTMPFRWTDVALDPVAQPLARQILQEAWDFGLRSGWSIPIYQHRRLSGFISASAGREIHASPDLEQLHLMTLCAHSRILQIQSVTGRLPHLRLREREVVTWLAHGKTADAIAQIMNISNRSVEGHIADAGHRLGTVNSTHTVVEAIRLKLISI